MSSQLKEQAVSKMKAEINESGPIGFSYAGTTNIFYISELKNRLFKDSTHSLVLALLELDEISPDIRISNSELFWNFIHVYAKQNSNIKEKASSVIGELNKGEYLSKIKFDYLKKQRKWMETKYTLLKPTMTLEEIIEYEAQL